MHLAYKALSRVQGIKDEVRGKGEVACHLVKRQEFKGLKGLEMR